MDQLRRAVPGILWLLSIVLALFGTAWLTPHVLSSEDRTDWTVRLAVFGLLLTIFGFTIALFQLARTRRAVEAAQEAVVETVETLAARQLLWVMTELVGVGQHLDRAIQDNERLGARRLLVRWNELANHSIGLLEQRTDAPDDLVNRIRASSLLARDAHGALSDEARTSDNATAEFRDEMWTIQSQVNELLGRLIINP